jgi:peroxiredoxin (alkyl hydroperoxide reductase subunit C)
MAIKVGRTSTASHSKTLKPGDHAPDFELDSHLGDEKWKLSAHRGKNIVLAFYPFAFTPV